MSKSRYYIEQQLESELSNTIEYDPFTYSHPLDFHQLHGLHTMRDALTTIPAGHYATPVDVSLADQSRNSKIKNPIAVNPAMWVIGAIAVYFLFVRDF